jgi:hypothetical protein
LPQHLLENDGAEILERVPPETVKRKVKICHVAHASIPLSEIGRGGEYGAGGPTKDALTRSRASDMNEPQATMAARRKDRCAPAQATATRLPSQATAAAKAEYKSPESGCASSQVIAIGFSPTWPR